MGSSPVSVRNREVDSLAAVPINFPGERSVWISVRMRTESCTVLELWVACLAFNAPIFKLPLAPLLNCEAFADACADCRHAGLGGFVSLPSPTHGLVSRHLHSLCTPGSFPLVSCGLFSAEILQLGISWVRWPFSVVLPFSSRVHFVRRCDNSPSGAASWKGLFNCQALPPAL